MTGLRDGSTPARVIDVLTTDGGWLSVESIRIALPGVSINTLNRALVRLHKQEHIQLHTTGLGHKFDDVRYEWKST